MTDGAAHTHPEKDARALLLAEDDEINRDIVRHFLSGIVGVVLTEAADGRAALTLCLVQRFDVVILDLRLPIIGGDRIARHLRSSVNPNSATPIILSTALAADELGEVLANCPHDHLLPKPLRRDEFLATIGAILSGAP